MGNQTINQNYNEEHLTFEQDLINRYKQRLRALWTRPNPYYKKGEYPTEYQDLVGKIKELKKIILFHESHRRSTKSVTFAQ